uniref:Zinc finger MYM-type protein 5-like n=1 Tax=Pelodiscus sinensis TaxID=13735 RepID=K7EXS2_PELSI|nr:zinc finger MYM-type protein 5-like [Pelodiscus sinensis]|eukprot:XP_025033872.1 zinc finger MYM-type protein 5-like [Pelodiscus sinensis]
MAPDLPDDPLTAITSRLLDKLKQNHPLFLEESAIAEVNISSKDLAEIDSKYSEELSSEEENGELECAPKSSLTDPAKWPTILTDKVRLFIAEQGPVQIKSFKFPRDEKNRSFSANHYSRLLNNGEMMERRWLVYSLLQDTVYCFSCKLFAPIPIALATGGFNDWKHLAERLKEHENLQNHREGMIKWTKTFEE